MSVSTSIKQSLINKINSLSSTQSVYGYMENNPSGFPAVWVTSSNMEGEFTSTAENRRSYAYDIMILYPIGQNIPKINNLPINEQAENVIADVVDDVINTLDNDFDLVGNSNALFMQASNAEWGFIDYEGGVAKGCAVTIVVESDYNVTT